MCGGGPSGPPPPTAAELKAEADARAAEKRSRSVTKAKTAKGSSAKHEDRMVGPKDLNDTNKRRQLASMFTGNYRTTIG